MSSFSVTSSESRPQKLLPTAVRRGRTSLTTSWAQAWRPRPPRRTRNASAAFTLPYFTCWQHCFSPEYFVLLEGREHNYIQNSVLLAGLLKSFQMTLLEGHKLGRSIIKSDCSSAMLCASIMTDHWEHVGWEHSALAALANASNTALQWLLDDKVAKIEDTSRKKGGATFLVPMNGGIWTMCVSLEEEEVSILSRAGFPQQPLCTNYLANNDEEEPRADWQHRMQNLSISCALVCLIVLGSAALVGAFGVCKHQISAVLITGVMYLLAGLFAMFTLMIIHFKRIQRVSTRGNTHGDDTSDGVIGPQGPALFLLSAREFSTSWSLDLGWGGVALAATTSILWILLSKIMRYNPISTMLL